MVIVRIETVTMRIGKGSQDSQVDVYGMEGLFLGWKDCFCDVGFKPYCTCGLDFIGNDAAHKVGVGAVQVVHQSVEGFLGN